MRDYGNTVFLDCAVSAPHARLVISSGGKLCRTLRSANYESKAPAGRLQIKLPTVNGRQISVHLEVLIVPKLGEDLTSV